MDSNKNLIGDVGRNYNSMKELPDIAGMKQTIEELRINEEKYRLAYMTSPDSINFSRLSDGMFVSVNEGFTNIFGYTEEDAIGRTSIQMNFWVNPDERARLVGEVVEKGKVRNFEAEFQSKDGRIICGSLSASLIYLDGIPHLLSVVRDITSQKQAEEALAKEQFLISALMNNLSDHVYFKDIDSRFIRNNKAHVLSFGLNDPDELVGKSDFDFFTEKAARQAFDDEQSIIKTGLPILKEEKLTRKDSSDAWFSAIKMPLSNKDGIIIGTFGISRDITLRKRSELQRYALYEITKGITSTNNLDELLLLIHNSLKTVVYAENFFVALYDKNTGLFSFPYFVDEFDSMPAPVTLRKSCSAYVYRTVKPLLLTQSIFDELTEMGDVELVGSNSPSWVGVPLQTPSEVIGVMVLQHYSKENVYSESDVKFLVSIGSQIAIAIERKKREEEITIKNGQLQTINAEKDKFFSIIAHDLRGPLSSFVGATQLLTESQTLGDDEIKQIMLSMKSSALNIYNLLENLLEWSRLKRGGLHFVGEALNLSSIINSGVAVLSESARKKGIGISIMIPEEIEVFADKHMLATVIRNIVSNAVKFSNPGGKVTLTAKQSDNTVEVKIADDGIGMYPELKEKLFLINEKTSRHGTAGELSTGLGLLLCKEFIDQLNGKIWVESEAGQGSAFFFTMTAAS